MRGRTRMHQFALPSEALRVERVEGSDRRRRGKPQRRHRVGRPDMHHHSSIHAARSAFANLRIPRAPSTMTAGPAKPNSRQVALRTASHYLHNASSIHFIPVIACVARLRQNDLDANRHQTAQSVAERPIKESATMRPKALRQIVEPASRCWSCASRDGSALKSRRACSMMDGICEANSASRRVIFP